MPIERQFSGKSGKFMAKLGDCDFPEIGLAESVELTRRIYDELGGDVRRDGLAIVLGMSPAGALSVPVSAHYASGDLQLDEDRSN